MSFFSFLLLLLRFTIVIVVEQRRVPAQCMPQCGGGGKHISKMPDDKIKCQMGAHYSNVMIV